MGFNTQHSTLNITILYLLTKQAAFRWSLIVITLITLITLMLDY
jgi:hypothetical protein